MRHALFHDVAQRATLDVFHDNEVVVAGFPQVVDLGDVAVGEHHRDLRLGDQHADEFFVRGGAREDLLDDHGPLDAVQIVGEPLEDLGHAALGDLLQQIILAHGG